MVQDMYLISIGSDPLLSESKCVLCLSLAETLLCPRHAGKKTSSKRLNGAKRSRRRLEANSPLGKRSVDTGEINIELKSAA